MEEREVAGERRWVEREDDSILAVLSTEPSCHVLPNKVVCRISLWVTPLVGMGYHLLDMGHPLLGIGHPLWSLGHPLVGAAHP